MSVTVSPEALENAQPVLTSEDMYRKGLDASIPGAKGYDVVTAHKWFNLAAMKGNREAQVYRKELLLEMTKEQVDEALRRAREWISQHKNIAV
ncbi:MAG: hypothetical protein ACWA5L_08295 [bacterium]